MTKEEAALRTCVISYPLATWTPADEARHNDRDWKHSVECCIDWEEHNSRNLKKRGLIK